MRQPDFGGSCGALAYWGWKDAAKKLTLHEGRTHYFSPFSEETIRSIIEPTDTVRDKFFANLKLCLLWLMGDHQRHLPNSNSPLIIARERLPSA
jgi:hypothetical protein